MRIRHNIMTINSYRNYNNINSLSANFNGQKLLNGELGGAKLTQTTAGEVKNGADDTAAVYALDFTGLTGADVIGGTVKSGDVTYEFVKTGEEATNANNTAIQVDADSNAAKIVDQLMAGGGTAPTYDDYTLADGGDKITFTETALDDDATADAVEIDMNGIGDMKLQIGDTADSYNQLKVGINAMDCASLSISGISVANLDSANAAIDTIKTAINTVSSQRGDLGAIQNRLEHTANNLSVMEENITNAESAIRDTDVSDEMMAYTKNNILIQSAQAMLAQANAVPRGVLQ